MQLEKERTPQIHLLLSRFVFRNFLAKTLAMTSAANRENNRVFLGVQLSITPQWEQDFLDVLPALSGKSLIAPEWCNDVTSDPLAHRTKLAIANGANDVPEIKMFAACITKALLLVKATYHLSNPNGTFTNWFDDELDTDITYAAGKFMREFHRCRQAINISAIDLLTAIKSEVACMEFIVVGRSIILVINNGYITYTPGALHEAEAEVLKSRLANLHRDSDFRPPHLERLARCGNARVRKRNHE